MPASSWSMLLQGHRAAQTLLLTLAVGVPATSVFVVATILPSIVADIGGAAFYTWSTMLYTVASVLGTASGGFIKATLGLRRGYMACALVFLVGSMGCAIAPHMLVLLSARTIQGGGGGALIALSWGMVGALYPEDLRPRVLSTISGVWGARHSWGPWSVGYLLSSGGGAGRSG
jgi:MFS family permease